MKPLPKTDDPLRGDADLLVPAICQNCLYEHPHRIPLGAKYFCGIGCFTEWHADNDEPKNEALADA